MELDMETFIVLDKRIDTADEAASDHLREGLRDRWEFGRLMLAERKGKRLPNGVLTALAEATKKSRSELNNRMRFAEQYTEEEKLSNALDSFSSWRAAVKTLSAPTAQPSKGEVPATPISRNAHHEAIVALGKQGISRDEIASEVGVTERIVRRELEIEATIEAAAPLDWKTIPTTYQQKIDLEVRRVRRNLEAEAQAAITAEIQRIFERTRAEYKQLKAQTDRILDAHKGVFTKADFSVIQACLHPDNSASTEKRAQAFDLFRAAQDLLVGEKDQPTNRIELPSLDELKRRRASKQ